MSAAAERLSLTSDPAHPAVVSDHHGHALAWSAWPTAGGVAVRLRVAVDDEGTQLQLDDWGVDVDAAWERLHARWDRLRHALDRGVTP